MPGLDGFETKDALPTVEAGVTPMTQTHVEKPEDLENILDAIKATEGMSA